MFSYVSVGQYCLLLLYTNAPTRGKAAGLPTETEEQVQAAARYVQEKGVDIVLAKLGTKGSMLIQKGQVLKQGILKADKVISQNLFLVLVEF